jgi:hypothetical protein
MQKIVINNIITVQTDMVVVAQSVDALRYKPENRVFDFGIFH